MLYFYGGAAAGHRSDNVTALARVVGSAGLKCCKSRNCRFGGKVHTLSEMEMAKFLPLMSSCPIPSLCDVKVCKDFKIRSFALIERSVETGNESKG